MRKQLCTLSFVLYFFIVTSATAQSGSYADYNRLSQATQRAFSVPDRYTITTYSSRVVSSSSSSYSSSSSSSNSSRSNPSSSGGGNSWAMPCRTCYQSWGPSYQQTVNYQERNYEEERRAKALQQERELQRQKEQQRLEAEYNRQLQEKARLEAAEKERARQIRLAYFKNRLTELKQNPLQTIYTPPVFATAKEKFAWYYNEANHSTGIEDNYAKVIVAQMALDGEGYASDLSRAINNNYDATYCSLSLCLAGEIKIAKKEKNMLEFENVFLFLHSATNHNDATKGDERAYKKLLEIYNRDSLWDFKLPASYNTINENNTDLCVSAKANVYAYAAKNGDINAAGELRYIMIRHTNKLKLFSKKRLLNMAQAFSLQGDDAYYGLLSWDNLGQKMELLGDTSCFTYYLKCLEKNNADKQFVNSMSVSVAKLSLNNPAFAKRLTVAQQKTILQNVKAYANSYDSMINNRGYISNADLMRYFDCYWGNSGAPTNCSKATEIAKEIIKRDDNEFAPLQKVALAYRLGTGGWPKDELKASEFFKLACSQIKENTSKEKEMKAMFASTTADYWKENRQLGLKLNNAELGYYLEEAARLDDIKGEEFADWVGNKKAIYFSKEKAIMYYSKSIGWYQNLHQLFVTSQMEDKITGPRIEAIKKKMADLN
ncbi:hypothetical protein [Ferruginibacter sp.]|nr:hypothetical protein [Ferruginibacter sp.]